MLVDRFIALGSRLFASGTWHRVPFQPLLYLMIWGAATRIAWDESVPAPFEQTLSPGAELAWVLLVLLCPPISLAAWWLIMRSSWPRSSLIGFWLRLGSDVGIAVALFTFHIADGLDRWRAGGEDPADFFSRYITAAALCFMVLVVVRDVWALLLTGRVARSLRDE